MRVTNRMIQDTVITHISLNARRVEELESQLTSGKKISRPSDDPPAVVRALAFEAGITAGEQYLRNMDMSLAWLHATDATLESGTQLLQRARELAVQGASDGQSSQQRDAIAGEIDQILEQMVVIGNSSLRGQRLFAGLKTDANPFTLNAGPPTTVSYAGDSGQMVREIDSGTTVQINMPGDSFLPQVFTALIDLRDDLRAGNSTAVGSSDLGAIDTAMDRLLEVRSDVGARVNRLENAVERQELIQVRLQELLSKTEDVDMAQAISNFALQENVYKASLAAGAKALQPSLLDYLR
ncbi:MAG: flagellar hook-associated protein FlgL [Chloroflexi bacterium]|nr:flagellar hook-associated protein FlgL [Chloroflexota bacterium]